ncbi:MAG TPA: hypothetical protein VGL81_30520 [Polyangiaceae bacterium]|jgi:hypothetical protein
MIAPRIPLPDTKLIESLESCTLSPEDFPHRAHVRAAWCYLRLAPFGEAGERFCRSLRRFAESVGRPQRFHATMSWAYLALIHERAALSPAATFDDFAQASPDLLDRATALSRFYDGETLGSDLARRVFVLPRRG